LLQLVLRFRDMSNEVGRVNRDSQRLFEVLTDTSPGAGQHPPRGAVRRSRRFCFSCSNPTARSVSLHLRGVVHQTCLRSVRIMMMSSNSLEQRGSG
jgi:hypothetical protein